MPRKIVVTGGAGFIGGLLVEALLRYSDCKIFVLDNYTTGTIENHVDNENVCYINGETKEISSLIDFKPDLVFHLGEYSRVEQSFDDWKLVFHT